MGAGKVELVGSLDNGVPSSVLAAGVIEGGTPPSLSWLEVLWNDSLTGGQTAQNRHNIGLSRKIVSALDLRRFRVIRCLSFELSGLAGRPASCIEEVRDWTLCLNP